MGLMKKYAFVFVLLTTFYVMLLSSAESAEKPCDQWIARAVSVQGIVEVRKAGQASWQQVKLNDIFCTGDMIRVQENSRAAVVLSNETNLSLDHNTTISFVGIEQKKTYLLDLLSGAMHFFSRLTRSIRVLTPFVNASVEGTEGLVRVNVDNTFLSIFEGKVMAANEIGSIILSGGQSAIAETGQAPVARVVVRPRDAVQWAMYYPPIINWRQSDFEDAEPTDWSSMVRKSIGYYWRGNLAAAFVAIANAPEEIDDPRFYTYRAALYLTVGRVKQAQADIVRALSRDSDNIYAFALQSIIHVVKNEIDQALTLANRAVESDPESSVARVALSFVQQSQFNIEGALNSLQKAVELDPENALGWARLAELYLSVGNIRQADKAAVKAVALNPGLSRTQTVLGFAYLIRVKINDAKNAFQRAIELDSAAPLPRLGLGLAIIRSGNLKSGRAEIEIAAGLAPNNSLIRSYLGKAYFDEKRDSKSKSQYEIAKKLDPLDPTPWFYDAIRKQTINRPVEALQDMQKSIELNDNRAVFRSRLLLDEDLAARSASLGRIYNDLGFQQLGLIEGWKSVNTAPANFSAHRLLADLYAALPRHEIARVSELLQSQLLQPININPVQPSLAESNLLILENAGPSDPSFNEFNPLFLRNRLALQANGVVGSNNTLGGEIAQSGVWNKFSYNLGLFHYETEGFRDNNDQNRDIFNLFTQAELSPRTSLLAEFRYSNVESGDLLLLYEPDDFLEDFRENSDTRSVRIGLRQSFTPNSEIIATASYRTKDTEQPEIVIVDEKGFGAEVQHLFRSERYSITSGAGYFETDREDKDISFFGPSTKTSDTNHANFYVYFQNEWPKKVNWTLGGSVDLFNGAVADRDQFNPKFGVTMYPFTRTTLRGAIFRSLKRTLLSDQTIEPTQVAGFNQFFDDPEGTEAWRYGVAIDQKFSANLYGGAEYSRRDLKVPGEIVDLVSFELKVVKTNWYERFGRAYLFWTPHTWLALGAEYQYERFDRNSENPGEENIIKLITHRFPFGINFFHPTGFFFRLSPTYVDQDIESFIQASDRFWVVDSSIGYRLPKRFGIFSIEAKNLLDEQFNFQDTDPATPSILPDRSIFARLSLSL